jgi:nitrogen fixation/metabolism regulation signal transduction histidine kinase
VLQVIEPVPKALAQDFETLRSGSDDYQKISLSRRGLKRLYAVTLTLTLLLALTSALGLAVVLSNGFRRRWACWPRVRAPWRKAISRGANP